QGPDVRGIEDVIQFGICTDVPETFQHGGHGGCDSDGFAFFLIMIEPWVNGININLLTDEMDPDQPIYPSSSWKVPTKQEHCGVVSIWLTTSPKCLRLGFANYFRDNSSGGTIYATLRVLAQSGSIARTFTR
ncbi:hypothetical protein L208DRAFT_1310761, partial [Tricholoma matsutake]